MTSVSYLEVEDGKLVRETVTSGPLTGRADGELGKDRLLARDGRWKVWKRNCDFRLLTGGRR